MEKDDNVSQLDLQLISASRENYKSQCNNLAVSIENIGNSLIPSYRTQKEVEEMVSNITKQEKEKRKRMKVQFSNERAALNAEIAKLVEEISNHQAIIDSFDNEKVDFIQQIKELKVKIIEKENEKEEIRKEMENNSKINELQEEHEMEVSDLNTKIAKLTQKLSDSENSRVMSQELYESANNENEELKKENEKVLQESKNIKAVHTKIKTIFKMVVDECAGFEKDAVEKSKEIALLTKKIQENENEKMEIASKFYESVAESESRKRKIDENEKEIDLLKNENEEKDRTIKEMKKEKEEMDNEIKKLNEIIFSLKETENTLNDKLSAKENEIASIKKNHQDEIKEMKNQMESESAERVFETNNLNAEIMKLQTKLSKVVQEGKDVMREKDVLKSENDALKTSVLKNERENKQLKEKTCDYEEGIKNLRVKIESYDTKLKERDNQNTFLRKMLNSEQIKSKEYEKQIEDEKKKNGTLQAKNEQKIKALSINLKESESTKAALDVKVYDLENKLSNITKQNEKSNDKIKSLQNEINSLKKELENSRNEYEAQKIQLKKEIMMNQAKEGEIKSLHVKLEEYENENNKLNIKMQSIEAEKQQMINKMDSSKESSVLYEKQIKLLRERLSTSQQEVSRRENENNNVIKRINELEKQLVDTQQALGSAQTQLKLTTKVVKKQEQLLSANTSNSTKELTKLIQDSTSILKGIVQNVIKAKVPQSLKNELNSTKAELRKYLTLDKQLEIVGKYLELLLSYYGSDSSISLSMENDTIPKITQSKAFALLEKLSK